MSTDPTKWVKARLSGANGNCVEMRRQGGVVEVRDTKDAGTGPTLGFSRPEFAAWLDAARRGEFDRLR